MPDILILNEMADIRTAIEDRILPFKPADVPLSVKKLANLTDYFGTVYEKYRVLNVSGGKILQFRVKAWNRKNWLPLDPTNFYEIDIGNGETDYLVYVNGILHIDVPGMAELRVGDSGDPTGTWHIIGGSSKHFLFRTDNTYNDLGTASFYAPVNILTTMQKAWLVLWRDNPGSLNGPVFQNWLYIDLIVIPIQKQEEGWVDLS